MLSIGASVIASLLLSAHFLRWGELGLTVVCLLFPLVLTTRWPWGAPVVGLYLIAGTLIWVHTGITLCLARAADGEMWTRAAIIIGGVAAFTAATGITFLVRARRTLSRAWPAIAAFGAVFVLCAVPHVRLRDPIPLLLERFIPGAGWIQILGLSTYAAWLVDRLCRPGESARLRGRLWLMFSVVFFAQFAIGVLGAEKFLMIGKLHLPVPALILAGPLYRGGGFFMVGLFLATIVLGGPMWCSWLCYIGSWDDLASRSRRVSLHCAGSGIGTRVALLAATVVVAIVLRTAGVPPATAALLGAGFGLAGVAVMVFVSRKTGTMTHCTAFCPLGLVTALLGRINPFRIRIGGDCNDCRACSRSCRYGALTDGDIARRRPGLTCTLCGDCLPSCKNGLLAYHFPGLDGRASRTLFLVIAVALHTVFLGLART